MERGSMEAGSGRGVLVGIGVGLRLSGVRSPAKARAEEGKVTMQRGRYTHLAALAGMLALAAGAVKPAQGAATPVNAPAAPTLTPGDGAVLVTYGGVLNAVGYNIYSHAAGSTPVLVNAKPT